MKVGLFDSDEPTRKAWSYYRSLVQDGALMAICHAVLTVDLASLAQIDKALFSHDAGVASTTCIACNQQLGKLGLYDTFSVGHYGFSDGDIDHNNMFLSAAGAQGGVRLALRALDFGAHPRVATRATRNGLAIAPDEALQLMRAQLIAWAQEKWPSN